MLKAFVIVLSIAYPFMVYWGLTQSEIKSLVPIIIIMFSLRWIVSESKEERRLLIATLLGLCIIICIYGHEIGLKFYPVLINLSFLYLFLSSLIYPPTIIERFARIRESNLSEDAIAYTRKVTIVWSIFFLMNGTIAAITVLFTSEEIWLLYNGMIAYLLIGLLAGGEWLVRQRMKRVDRVG